MVEPKEDKALTFTLRPNKETSPCLHDKLLKTHAHKHPKNLNLLHDVESENTTSTQFQISTSFHLY